MASQYEPLKGATVADEWPWQPRARRYFIVVQALALAAVAAGILLVVFQTMVLLEMDSSGHEGGADSQDTYSISSSSAVWFIAAQLCILFLVSYLIWTAKMNKSNPRARLSASVLIGTIVLFLVGPGLTASTKSYLKIAYIRDDPNATCFYYKRMSNTSNSTPIPTPLCEACRLTSPPSQSLCCCCSGPNYLEHGTMSYYGVSSCEIVFGWIFTAELAIQRLFEVSFALIILLLLIASGVFNCCHRNPALLCGRWTDTAQAVVISSNPLASQATSRRPLSEAQIRTESATIYPDTAGAKRGKPSPDKIDTGYGATEPTQRGQDSSV